MKRLLLVCLSLLLMSVSGCAWFESKEEKSAQELVQDGVDYFEAGKYKKAVESFEKLRDWYPFSRYAILAELKIADAYFNLESYADAIFAYEEFEQLHPRNEAIPYVVFRIGRSYFNQIDTIDRDQSNAAKALETYLRLIRNIRTMPTPAWPKAMWWPVTRAFPAMSFTWGRSTTKIKITKPPRHAFGRGRKVSGCGPPLRGLDLPGQL
jgi:tetratricopeptide (TPR) repeat protein